MSLKIDCDFPGGNIIVDNILNDTVLLHQDLRDTSHDWFYWCFRLRGAEGLKLHFNFTQSRAIGVRGPAISYNAGITWEWLGIDCVHENTFVFTVPSDQPEVRLSFAMPYQESDWLRFISRFTENTLLSRHALCKTSKERNVEYIVLGKPDTEPQHRLVITCRHHCCEMMVNYALEGIIQWMLESDDNNAGWLRDNVQMLIIPFVDKDGVEDGDQGKDRKPRDHGRDYDENGIYASTRAIQDLLPVWGNGLLRVCMDLHCPWISGRHNEEIYLVGSVNDRIAKEEKRFSKIMESTTIDSLPFRAEDYLAYGTEWNTGTNYANGKSFTRWAADLPGVMMASAIEIPYANIGGKEANRSSLVELGKNIGMALAQYLGS